MGPIAVFDFTASAKLNNKETITTCLKEIAKKWAFQLEKGKALKEVEEDFDYSDSDSSSSEDSGTSTDTSGTTDAGYLHYQGKLSLKSKMRKGSLISLFKNKGIIAHVTPTLKKNINNYDYVQKEDTRVEGPWTSEDVPMPKHLEQFIWLPWIQHIKDDLDKHDWRTINWVYDRQGCKGKSWVLDMFTHLKLVHELEPMRDHERMSMTMASLHNQFGCRRGIFVEFMRSYPRKQMEDMLTALERVKGGRFIDTRNHAKPHMCFLKPNVWVFANFFPDFGGMSSDRWKFWRISDKDELIEIEHPGRADWERKQEREEEYIIKDKE